MKCKNCGARLGADETTCPNCGAITDTDSGYTIITADDRVEDLYSNDEKKPHKRLRLLIVLLLVVALAAGGSYLYFHYILPLQQARPELTFTTGTGVIWNLSTALACTMDRPRANRSRRTISTRRMLTQPSARSSFIQTA